MSWLDLRRLIYFRAILEEGSLSAAARKLSVPQPALSYHLKELEADFGARLVTRSRTGVVATEGGQLLLDHAVVILAQVARAEEELRRMRARGAFDAKVLRIAAIPSLATALTPELLQRSGELTFLSGLYVIEANIKESREMLRSGEIDLAVVIADEDTPSSQWLGAENMLFCMSADHPDTSTHPVTLAEALCEPLMLPRVGKPVRVLVDGLAASIGAHVQVIHEIDGPNPRKQAVMAGLGRTFLPWIAVRDEVAAGLIRVRDVIDPPLFRHVALEHGDRLPSDELDAISDILRDIVGRIVR
ncbi:MAG: LysR family transcriptional regulator [Cereibacter changlensis]